VENLTAPAVQDQEAAVKRRNHDLAHMSVANVQGKILVMLKKVLFKVLPPKIQFKI
jgi:hypothetical protein